MRITAPISFAVGAAALLAGCTASVNFTVSADTFATEVAAALQEQVGTPVPPTVDCGDQAIDLVVDEVVMCTLSVDGDDAVYDTTVTITEADGTDYTFFAQVAQEPR